MRALVDKELDPGLCHVWGEVDALVGPVGQAPLGDQIEDGSADPVPPLRLRPRPQQYLEGLQVTSHHGVEQEAEVTL